jgi:cellulose synthase/poly-beta-1,6-N-acetylglucosamine synthase-like glycosyltransferase
MVNVTTLRVTMSVVFYFVLVVYALVLGLLFIYGLNFYYLSYQACKHRHDEPTTPPLVDHPHVTVQLPLYNERHVAHRLIDAVAALDWPTDRLQIQVLDDSTDETVHIVATAVARHVASGLNITHIRRDNRVGYKAGALAHGLRSADGEFIAIFDADFLPSPDFLNTTIPCFADAQVGFVQTRWDHLNDNYSLFTRLQALSIDGHFVVEQFARFQCGFFMNFNGTAGVWRRETIDDAGGWSADTLTEDLDLSYRAQLKGWQSGYLRQVSTPGELPITMTAYRRQQYRWARGSFETALRMIPGLIKAPLAGRVKIQALLHLTGYGIHALMFLLTLLYPLVVHLSVGRPYLVTLFGIATLFNFTAFAPTTYFALAQVQLGRQWWKHLPAILFLSVLGSGMMVNNLQAILHAFSNRTAVFERTPKFGTIGRGKKRTADSYRAKVSPLVLVEAVMLAFNLNTLRVALKVGHIIIAIYSGIFVAGLAYVLTLTVWHALQPGISDRLSSWLSGTVNDPQEV